MFVPRVFHGDVGGTREAYGPSPGRESLSGSPSSVKIWSRSVCARRCGRAGEEGCRLLWVGCGGGVRDLRFLRVGVCVVFRWIPGVGSEGPSRLGGGPGVTVFSVRRKASSASLPPRIVRMWFGPCGEGANCTRHPVSGESRSAFLGRPLGRLAAVAACRSAVGTPSSRLWIEVITKP